MKKDVLQGIVEIDLLKVYFEFFSRRLFLCTYIHIMCIYTYICYVHIYIIYIYSYIHIHYVHIYIYTFIPIYIHLCIYAIFKNRRGVLYWI